MPQKKSDAPVPMTITLTLPEPGSDGTLIAQRGDLAHISQFAHTTATDFTQLVRLAVDALTLVEAQPPVIPELPPPPRKTPPVRSAEIAVTPPEQVIQVPKKKGTAAVPARCLLLPDDEAAQKLGVKIAGKLLASELWDGQVPIRIADPAAVQRQLRGLTTKELNVLFTLEQFVEVNPPAAVDTDPAMTVAAEVVEADVQTK